VNLYASRIDDGSPFSGEVTFKVRDDKWFASEQETLGIQRIDDGVYRQGFVFKQAGNYIITAAFASDGEPYSIDFPLRIGNPAPIGPLGISVAVVTLVLVGVNVTARKRLQRMKAQDYRAASSHEGSNR
jgi:hypothetical protein